MKETAPELLAELRRISARHCLEEGGPHGPDHTERVVQNALAIGRELGARLDILASAALLHDIGRSAESRSKGGVCHAETGAELAESILRELNYSTDDRAAICHCIRAHRFRGCTQPESLEAKILFDADKLDSIGAVGIGRAFLFAGQIGARLHNADLDHGTTAAYSGEDTAYREFQVKMSRVRGQLHTAIGRKIARRRHEFMETFFAELNLEIYGCILQAAAEHQEP
ncbi:MAG: HD domain-containing protein [Candidatus Electronema sp. V4]|uniref:HD domain-containing protein n=1 Tax=Candidatus Electronema sp. V4 TaxID=3454756 RepID=UPI0040554F13